MEGRVAFTPASALTLDQVTRAFNHAFEAYYLPMAQTPSSLDDMIRENDVQLDVSRVLTVDGAPEGIGLAGVRGDRGWIAGMGIGPAWRGRGLGRALLERLLSALRNAGVQQAQLETLVINTPALALYQRMGFHETRELCVYQGLLRAPLLGASAALRGRLAPVARHVALKTLGARHPVAPAWQREARSLAQSRRPMTGLGLWDGDRLRAYVLTTRTPEGYLIHDAESDAETLDQRREDVAAMLLSLTARQASAVARAINAPPDETLRTALDWLGCPVVARQREMARAL